MILIIRFLLYFFCVWKFIYLSWIFREKTDFLWVRINWWFYINDSTYDECWEMRTNERKPKFVVSVLFLSLLYLMTDWIISCNFVSLRSPLSFWIWFDCQTTVICIDRLCSVGLGVCVCDGLSLICFISSCVLLKLCIYVAAAACDWVRTCRLLILCIFLFRIFSSSSPMTKTERRF